MISICKDTNNWCHFDLNNIYPPTLYKSSTFDLIYAYSVFSHLSEKCQKAWLEEFHRILRPEGVLIVTTRQKKSIPALYNQLYEPSDQLELPVVIDKALKDYAEGKFVYFGIEGAFGFEEDFFGEAFIPEAYVRKEWSNLFKISNFIKTSNIDQNIIVAQKNG
jgi:predicted SAM-dependent methyltransferase